jgi:hypothetical protein
VEGSSQRQSSKGRALLIGASLIVLGLWAASAVPIYQTSKTGRGDGFEAIPFVYASMTLLPLSAAALHGAWKARPESLRRARLSLLACAAALALVVALNVFMAVANRHPEWNLGDIDEHRAPTSGFDRPSVRIYSSEKFGRRQFSICWNISEARLPSRDCSST